ncbi:ferredoxin [Bacillus sp. 03113]|uniref:(2Fe-2S) ferredoxin domain-containing protein n=1 Tax=Bacillus sp. 03113 TaxID=2578211 RepID=UPI001142B5AA|nr:(2Fe-2S) ferredoxin domain-containing protein [Bacillus sp. 03113]
MATWDLSRTKHHVLICNGSSCNKCGAEELTVAIRKEISDRDLDDVIHTTRTRCNGRCQDKCVVIAYPSGNWYKEMNPEDSTAFVDSLLNNRDLTGKISHSYTENGFEREEGVVKGVGKEKEIVQRVSK